MRRLGIIGLLILLFTASGCATTTTTTTGVIRGRLAVSKTAGETRPRDLDEAIVYVEKLAPERLESQPLAVKVQTRNNAFVPRVVAVEAGMSVEFHNPDRVYHNAFSISQSKRFDLGSFKPGASHVVTFDKPGIVSLYCELHSNETGFVLVLPNPAFARADATGTFVLPPLPQGDYTVKAWHPRLGERRARVKLNGADDVTLRLRF